jgi:hypothetical protein
LPASILRDAPKRKRQSEQKELHILPYGMRSGCTQVGECRLAFLSTMR